MTCQRGTAHGATTARPATHAAHAVRGAGLPALLGVTLVLAVGCGGSPQQSQQGEAAAVDDAALGASTAGTAGTAGTAATRGAAAHDHVHSLPAATPAQLRRLERMMAPQLARPADVEIEVRDDGTHVMHPGDGYYHVTAAVVRGDGRFEIMCLEQPSIPDHTHPVRELR